MATPDPGTPPGTPPQKRGLSTGAKVLIGCLGALVLVGVVLAAALGLGGLAFMRQIDNFAGGLEEQQEASERMEQLTAENPFEAPEDGAVTEDQLDRFLAVTDQAWENIRPWAEDLRQLEQRTEEREGGGSIRDMAAGVQAIGGFARARVQLAEALEEEGMAPGEYVWTGLNLARAMEAIEGDRPRESVPEGTLQLAERHQDRLAGLEGEGDDPGPALVVAVATLWGMSDMSTWQALGLDTLNTR